MGEDLALKILMGSLVRFLIIFVGRAYRVKSKR